MDGGLFDLCHTDSIEVFSLIVAAACHDYKHPGVNNVYLTEMRDPIAIQYNGKMTTSYNPIDISVLENYHVAQTFALFSNTD